MHRLKKMNNFGKTNGNCVAVIGSHGSGKTTLLKKSLTELRKASSSKPIAWTFEVARHCPYEVGTTSNELAQNWIMRMQNLLEYTISRLGVSVILDRCLIDQYAYYVYWVGRSDALEKQIKMAISRYSSIFMLPSNPQYLIGDGLRPINPEFQKQIDSIILEIVNTLEIDMFRCSKVDDSVLQQLIDAIHITQSNLQQGDMTKNEFALWHSQHALPMDESRWESTITKLIQVDRMNAQEMPSIKVDRVTMMELKKWLVRKGFKLEHVNDENMQS